MMFERALNVVWILLGAAAAAYSWTLGIVGPSGPESGLAPAIAALAVSLAGGLLLVRPSGRAPAPNYPRGAALVRVLGVIAGLAVMAIGMSYVGFALAGAVTMMILLRTVEEARWSESILLSVGSVAVILWLFGNVLGMALPRGPWGW